VSSILVRHFLRWNSWICMDRQGWLHGGVDALRLRGQIASVDYAGRLVVGVPLSERFALCGNSVTKRAVLPTVIYYPSM
jgi:hypothetical protein